MTAIIIVLLAYIVMSILVTAGLFFQKGKIERQISPGKTEIPDESRPDLRGETVEAIVRHEMNIQSYFDIMRGGHAAMKKSLIRKIQDEWTPNGISLLKIAVTDPDYEIRSYAATTLSQIENEVFCRIREEKEASKTNGDTAVRFRLAKRCLQYAGLGLLDAVTVKYFLHEARENLVPPQTAEQRIDHLLMTGALKRRLGEDEAAVRAYEEALALAPRSEEALVALCELHLRRHDYAALRDAAKILISVISPEHPAWPAVKLWEESACPTSA